MGFEGNGTVTAGEVRLKIPLSEGTQVRYDIQPLKKSEEPRSIHEMSEEQFNAWLNDVTGDDFRFFEAEDPPPEPIDWPLDE